METINLTKLDEVYFRVDTEESVEYEMSDHFTFDVPGARWSPKFKKKKWDGKIRMFNRRSKTIHVGLLNRIKEFADEMGYSLYCDIKQESVDYELIKEIYESIDRSKFDNKKQLENQLRTFIYCIKKGRAVILSPTGSGKSLIIYMVCMYYLRKRRDRKVLIIVPTISLVDQMSTDFHEYGYDKDIHRITGGVEHDTDREITVSTWQSIYEEEEDFFKEFDVVVGDECHLYEAKSIRKILENMKWTPYRFGFTGTLTESKTNEMTLNGLFGPVKRFVTTKEQIDDGILSRIQIDNVILDYPQKERAIVSNRYKKYQDEIDYIVSHERRLRYTARLAGARKGNTLVLYRLVEKHGEPLYRETITQNPDRKVFFVSGEVDKDRRNEIRRVAEENDDCIIVASYGTFSTGINIRRLHNIIFASPYKSKIKVLQSIGRGLRKHESKEKLHLIDLVDDLKNGDRINHALKHFMQRVRMYNVEKLLYNIHTVEI